MNKPKSNFSPKKYLDGKINSQCCNHELVTTSSFDEGMYGFNYDCLICGEHIHTPSGSFSYSENNHFIYYSCLSQFDTKLIQTLLHFVCERFKDEDSIDIVSIFQKMQKSIQQIDSIIWPPTDKERENTLKYYDDLLNNSSDKKSGFTCRSKKRI